MYCDSGTLSEFEFSLGAKSENLWQTENAPNAIK